MVVVWLSWFSGRELAAQVRGLSECSVNNIADTVFQLFTGACNQYEAPSRVRCDYGVEKVQVARWMLNVRGLNHSSIITGSLVHNQHIERL